MIHCSSNLHGRSTQAERERKQRGTAICCRVSRAIRTSIEAARSDLADAETELEKAMRAIRVAPRAEKTTISELLEAAFTKLKAARAKLGELETILSERGE